MSVVQARDGVIGISPLERPDVGLVTAIRDAGALGVLDVGRDPNVARRALSHVNAVRIPEGVDLELPPNITTVIVGEPSMVARYVTRNRIVLAQVTSLDEAHAAIAAGANGLIAKGSEAGGRIGDETTFVLVQRLADLDIPVWAQGGIGEHTAAACIAGGAAGVVLDSQLALVRESSLAAPIRAAIAAMDGSETTVLFGHRVFTRPDLTLGKQVS
jgi:NAD(P)H-dependent flavin oxidoreductase YrpB (nitropropane dioxygenase family)